MTQKQSRPSLSSCDQAVFCQQHPVDGKRRACPFGGRNDRELHVARDIARHINARDVGLAILIALDSPLAVTAPQFFQQGRAGMLPRIEEECPPLQAGAVLEQDGLQTAVRAFQLADHLFAHGNTAFPAGAGGHPRQSRQGHGCIGPNRRSIAAKAARGRRLCPPFRTPQPVRCDAPSHRSRDKHVRCGRTNRACSRYRVGRRPPATSSARLLRVSPAWVPTARLRSLLQTRPPAHRSCGTRARPTRCVRASSSARRS